MKNVCILGSTGSIGISTIEVVRKLSSEFQVFAISCYNNTELLLKQAELLKPKYICVANEASAKKIPACSAGRKTDNYKLLVGTDGLCELASHPEADIILNALVGSEGVHPTLAAIRANKKIAMANKETLVAYGTIIMKELANSKAILLPVDSEHSAIHQCLNTGVLSGRQEIKQVILTASGGPFWNAQYVEDITPESALKHPVWKMGEKITIDSATLMNKGFEVIEASVLFGIPVTNVEVVIHPQSIVHSMVEFTDSSIIAQLALPDMKLPIQYALTYPARLPSLVGKVEFTPSLPDGKAGMKLEFSKPDFKKFPCLRLAYEAARIGGTMLSVLNAADEAAVKEFLNHRIKFNQIPKVIEDVMGAHTVVSNPCFDEIKGAEDWARGEAFEVMK